MIYRPGVVPGLDLLNNIVLVPLQDIFRSAVPQPERDHLSYRYLQGVQQNCLHLVICSFVGFLVMQNAKVGTFFKKLGNLLHDRHKNFEIRFRNS